jgi:pyruvate/2-oxoglutarate dehydrogenase complex dihydrolipoamide dehydrogenase (E3) component
LPRLTVFRSNKQIYAQLIDDSKGVTLVSAGSYNSTATDKVTKVEQAAIVGKEVAKKAIEAGYEIKVGNFPFVASGKATAAGAREGFVKVIYDAKYGELLGAHMIGYNVTELIAEAVVVRKLESTAYEIMKSIHPHPTMSEAFKGATEAAYGEAVDL